MCNVQMVLPEQVEAIVKRNHERAADALRALLPALHPDMLKPPEAVGLTNGSSLPEIQVRVYACIFAIRHGCMRDDVEVACMQSVVHLLS